MATTSSNRTHVGGQQYSAPEFDKSGFSLTHNRYSSYQLGKIHVSGLQWIMPGDKVSGQNITNLTAHRIVTPMVTPIDVSQYNFFLPLRALDTSFVDGLAPSKNNDMSQGWSAPMTTLQSLVNTYFLSLYPSDYSSPFKSIPELYLQYPAFLADYEGDTEPTIEDFYQYLVNEEYMESLGPTFASAFRTFLTQHSAMLRGAYTTQLYQDAQNHYLVDGLEDCAKYFDSFGFDNISIDTPINEFWYNLLTALLTPFFGRYSYLCELRLPYLSPSDIYQLAYNPTVRGLGNGISQVSFNEYSLRFMYALWYERFRDVNLEPVSSNLPKWRQFSSSPVITPIYCLYRFRSWYNDMFVSAQPDDMSRHVWAPVVGNPDSSLTIHNRNVNNQDAQPNSLGNDSVNDGTKLHNINSVQLQWRDSLTGEQRTLYCPVPANINDSISQGDSTSLDDVYGLQLSALRQAKMLERYLKRNYLFGDEYQDRMLAHYNSRVSDMRINRPELLSSSLDSVNFEQQVSNVSTDETKVGDRTATATASGKSDNYTFFAEEFGLLVNILTIMPHAQYDGILGQALIQKQVDFPLPEFAANNEEFGRKLEVAGTGLYTSANNDSQATAQFIFGHYPAYHAWRERVDEVGGEFLNELQNATFRRFFGMFNEDTTPKLNYMFIHCDPNLDMFADNVKYNAQFYGDTIHECYVERVLPTPVEVI